MIKVKILALASMFVLQTGFCAETIGDSALGNFIQKAIPVLEKQTFGLLYKPKETAKYAKSWIEKGVPLTASELQKKREALSKELEPLQNQFDKNEAELSKRGNQNSPNLNEYPNASKDIQRFSNLNRDLGLKMTPLKDEINAIDYFLKMQSAFASTVNNGVTEVEAIKQTVATFEEMGQQSASPAR
jgi:hypothetical protein